MSHLIRNLEFPPPNHPFTRPPPPIVVADPSNIESQQSAAVRMVVNTASASSSNPGTHPSSEVPLLVDADISVDQGELLKIGDGDDYTMVDVASDECDDQDEDVVCSQPIVPYVGMMFDTLEEAKKVYNEYAYKFGFGMRIACSRISKVTNQIIRREFECSHSRKPVEEVENSTSNSVGIPAVKTIGARKRNRMVKFGCKAHMTVGLRDGKWKVIVMQEDYNHPVVERVARRRFYRSHRRISWGDFEFLKTLHHRNISTSHIMALLGDIHGGIRNLTFTKTDVRNLRTNLRQGLTFRDMAVTIEYFQKMQAESPSFFYAVRLDENQAVRTLFWVDGRTRSLYQSFRDCVFFDTTFMTNRYNMPFAPFVGINNHMQTILLGCALLPDETTETFVWLFETWKLAMNGQPPICIMTDQDRAMKAAIAQVFPDAIHRCCKWHVMQKAQEKLARLISTKQGLSDDLHTCVNLSETVDEFESSWQDMLQKYSLHDNQHLQNMWNSKHTWAPAYFRKNFFPFTSTTGRSEGLNAIFKKLIHPQDSIWTFVNQYEYIMDTRLDREDGDGFKGETTNPPMWSRYNLEKEASKFYTRSVFYKFQEQLMQTTYYSCTMLEGHNQVFVLAVPGMNPPKTFRVSVHEDTFTYMCSCNKFEMDGLLCAHILKVMTHLNLQQIPQQYLLKRWSEQATQKIPEHLSGQAPTFGVPATNKLRYNSLCRKMTDLASDACLNEETYNIVSDAISSLSVLIAATSNPSNSQQGDAENSASGLLQNPPRSVRKGRPTEKSQRKKPPIEKATDKKKKQKAKIHCSYCNEDTHNVQKCRYLELAKIRDSFLADKEKRDTELKL